MAEDQVPPEMESRGWALASYTLIRVLLVGLQKNGVFTADQVFQIGDVALHHLEEIQRKHPDDQTVQAARANVQRLLDSLRREAEHPPRR